MTGRVRSYLVWYTLIAYRHIYNKYMDPLYLIVPTIICSYQNHCKTLEIFLLQKQNSQWYNSRFEHLAEELDMDEAKIQ